MKIPLVYATAALVSGLLIAGCGAPSGYGAPVPKDGAITPLSDVLSNPGRFSGKTVLLEGSVSAVCPSFCDFTYAEGTVSATVFPRDFTLKGLKKGDRVRVHAEVVDGKERPVVSALGVARL